jgi:hypothetical protein
MLVALMLEEAYGMLSNRLTSTGISIILSFQQILKNSGKLLLPFRKSPKPVSKVAQVVLMEF